MDFLTIGDTAWDTYCMLSQEAADLSCGIDKENCLLSLSFANKIPLSEIHHTIGGNAANAAVSGARLGMATSIVSTIGNDEASKSIAHRLELENVDLANLKRDKITNQSIALVYKGERTILVHHEPRNYRFGVKDGSRWIYLTSMGRGGEEMAYDVVRYAEDNNAQLVFSPGTYQLQVGHRPYKAVLQNARTIILNKKEAIEYTGSTDKSDIKDLLAKLLELGPQSAVITEGGEGSYAASGSSYLHCPAFEAEKVESTGAGDAYASAFVAAMFHGLSIEDAMRWGSVNSASVIGFIGPQRGLLTRAQLEHRLAQCNSFQTRSL